MSDALASCPQCGANVLWSRREKTRQTCRCDWTDDDEEMVEQALRDARALEHQLGRARYRAADHDDNPYTERHGR